MKSLLLLLLLVATSGCTLTHYRSASESVTRVTIGTAQSLGPIAVRRGGDSFTVGSVTTAPDGELVSGITAIAK